MEVLVNQLGYDPEDRTRILLKGADGDNPGAVRVESARSGEVVASAEPERAGHVHDWEDWVFWTADVSGLTEEGTYVATVDAGNQTYRSYPFEVEANLLAKEAIPNALAYFRVERSSDVYDRADREAPFVGDREDQVDVSGGWYDASGDVSKYLTHLGYANYMNPQQIPMVVWGLLDAADRIHSGRDTGWGPHEGTLGEQMRFELLEEATFGADFLVRVHDDAGYFYTTIFDGWSHDPEQREICAFEGFEGEKTDDYEAGFRQGGGVAIASLARASTLEAGGEFGTDTYLETAIEGYDHLDEHNEAYLDDGEENLLDDYCALLAAVELVGAVEAAPGDVADASTADRFRAAADDRARSLLDRQTDEGWFYADDGERPFFHAAEEGLPIVALCRYLALVGDDGDVDVETVREAIRSYWEFELALTDEVVNPFGYARQYSAGLSEDEPRGRFFMPHDNETGYWWQGEDARIGSMAAAALLTARTVDDVPTSDLAEFARNQLDWILGVNPFDVCMLEGTGRDPQPFLPNAPGTPGGIVNGVTATMDDPDGIAFMPDAHADDHDNTWRWTEQWLPHTTWFVVAAALLEGET